MSIVLRNMAMAPWGGPSVTTSATGAFEILGLPQSPLAVEASHPDFAPTSVEIPSVTSPPTIWPVRLQMTVGGRIEGVVLQKHGTPLAGLRVEVQTSGNGRAPMQTLLATTLEDGSFSLGHVPTGPAPIVRLLSPRGGALAEADRTPSGSIREGQVTKVTFGRWFVRIHGRLTRAGSPLPRAVVRPLAQWGYEYAPSPRKGSLAYPNDGATDAEGRFQLFSAPGSIPTMVASLDGRRLYGRHTIVVPDVDDPEVEMAMAGGETLSGQVVDRASRKGIEGAMLDIRRRSKMGELTRLMLPNQGRFSIDLEPDDYLMKATALGYQPTEVTIGVYGSAPAPLTLELGHALQISGRVVGCDSEENGPLYCSISIRSLDGREPAEIGVEPDGRFRLDVLEQKAYNLCAGSDKAGWAVLTGVQAGSADVILTVQPAGRLALTIRDPDGRPVSGALPVVRSVQAGLVGFPTERLVSDAEGRLEFQVPAGDVEIDLRSQRYKGRIRVQASSGTTLTHEVTLTESSGLP